MNPNQSANPTQQPAKPDGSHSADYIPSPNVDRNDAVPPSYPASGENWTSVVVASKNLPAVPPVVGQPSHRGASTTPHGPNVISGVGANPYVSSSSMGVSPTNSKYNGYGEDYVCEMGKEGC